MAALPRAAIELRGPSMRYAEVEPSETGGPRLLRLGACDFNFDVRAALERGHEAHLATLADAIRDVFAGSRADGLIVALAPAGLTAWAAPFDAAERDDAIRARLEREAELLAGSEPHILVTHPLFDEPDGRGGTRAWAQVIALPEPWIARLERATRGLDRPGARTLLSTQAAADALAAVLDGPANGAGVPGEQSTEHAALAVGLYDGHAEFALIAGGHTRLTGHARTAEPADAAFAALRLVGASGLARAPRTLRLYGTHATPAAAEAFGAAFALDARPLDALDALTLGAPRPDGFDAEPFAPVVGAALGRSEG